MERDQLVFVCGSRWWPLTKREVIGKVIRRFDPDHSILMHGQAHGADSIAGFYAKRIGIPVIEVPYIGKLGKRGGPERNKLMAELLNALSSECNIWAYAFPMNDSVGTIDMIGRLNALHIDVEIINGDK